MTEKLRDPSLEPWEIVEETEDGGAVRNDGTVLKPASQNPWYVLATIWGEQPEGGFDEDLAARNRRAWNQWACQDLDEEERATLAEAMGLEAEELGAGWEAERAEIEARFRARFDDPPDLPSPK